MNDPNQKISSKGYRSDVVIKLRTRQHVNNTVRTSKAKPNQVLVVSRLPKHPMTPKRLALKISSSNPSWPSNVPHPCFPPFGPLCPNLLVFNHLIEQQIYLSLHSQNITRLALFDLIIGDAPPPVHVSARPSFRAIHCCAERRARTDLLVSASCAAGHVHSGRRIRTSL